MKELYQLYLTSTGVVTDTRKIESGNIFFALKGDRFNGNVYAAKALELGAAHVIIDEIQEGILSNYTLVDDVLKTLQNLATYHRQQFDIPVLAITGSNGKTTTKELVREVLASTYKVHCTKGNFNNHIGVPLTLLEMEVDTEIAIVEMGANHPGEIDFLCQIAEPTLGLVTNVGRAHLEGFGGFQGVIKTKGELYRYLGEHGKLALVNWDEEHLLGMAVNCRRKLPYGRKGGQKHISISTISPFLKIDINGSIVETQLVGKYNFPNILTAIAVGTHFNVRMERMKHSIEMYSPKNNRSQFIKRGNIQIILDAYNANPTSMKAALENFKEMEGTKKVVILGDMLELGDESIMEHQGILYLAKEMGLEEIYTVGAEFSKVNTNQTFANVAELKKEWNWTAYENATILIKGSRGIRLEKLLEEDN